MDENRRTFLGLSAALAAASASAGQAAAAIDPRTAPRARFWIAALTPVDSRGAFDNGANDAMLAYWKEQGADGVLLLGTTGEGQSFSIAERKKVLEAASRDKHGLDFIVATGTPNVPDTVDLSRHAADQAPTAC